MRKTLRELSVLLLVLACALPGAGAADTPELRYLVQVRLASPEHASELAAAGFDVAGVNRKDSTAGVVATADDLKRLTLLGYVYAIERTNADASTLALQDYTDPVEMSAFMDQVAAAYPNLAQKVAVSPALFEGQQIWAMKITKDVALDNGRPTFVLDAQHHAREVMTAEIARDMIDYLTSRYGTDPQVTRWVDNVNIWVVGSVNPDGAMYVFQHDNMWRKNRHPACAVDVNRNYPFAWGSCNGSSALCSDETNRGFEPASEPETQAMLQLASATHAFYALSYHSYGEYIMYSYGCVNPNEMTAMDEVAHALNGILQDDAGQTNSYAVGPIWSTIYLVDGGSVDTWYANYGTYAYTIEVNSSSFQPDYATWRDVTVQRQRTAWQFFLDKTLDGPQIRGTVTDAATGAPLVATVAVQEVSYTHGEQPRRSDSKGHYSWLARNGQTYHVSYSKAGYCPLTQAVTVGAGPATLDAAIVQPTPPAAVTATGNGDNRIDVSWLPAVNATNYRVLRSLTSGGPYEEVGFVDAPTTSFADTTVSGSATYYYVVRSLQPCESQNSAEASGSTTGACFVGPAFSGIGSVTNTLATTCALELAWPAAATRCGGAVTYEVYRDVTSPVTPSPATRIASGLTGTQYVDHAALADGTTYHYVVRAIDAGNGTSDGNVVDKSAVPTGPTAAGTWLDDAGDTTAAALIPAAPWSVTATGGHTGPKVYATGPYTNNLCAALTTPALTLQAGATLTFASKYDIETGWDAAIVEIATGPSFGSWSRLTTVNYPDALTNTGNACGFPKSFSGTVFSRLYTTPVYPATNYTASLAAYAGMDVKLRWRISSDSTGTGKGMWVDDVAVTNAVFRQVCAAGPIPAPMEAGRQAAPMNASRGPSGTAVSLTYGPGCGTLDNAVYWGEGPIVAAPSWTHAACALGNTGAATFDPGDPAPGAFVYFVIVGQSASSEGSYGTRVDAGIPSERPEASGVGSCDLPQDLSGACP